MRLLVSSLVCILLSQCEANPELVHPLSFRLNARAFVSGFPVINTGSKPVHVVAWYNETLAVDDNAIASPGPGYPFARDQSGRSEDQLAPEIEKVVNLEDESYVPVLYLTVDPKQDIPPDTIQTLRGCMNDEGSDCEYVRRTQRSAACRPFVRIMKHIHIVMLDYTDGISECSIADVTDDVNYLSESLMITKVEAAPKEQWEEEPELSVDETQKKQEQLLEQLKDLSEEHSGDESAANMTARWQPNDPISGWHLEKYGMLTFSRGISEVAASVPLVAIITNGVWFNHPDLKDNVWVNSAELKGRVGVDDDGNGYVDDTYGWTAGVGTARDPLPGVVTNDVGTRMAGAVGAITNNGRGVASTAQNYAKLAICSYGTTAELVNSKIAECIDWALSVGAKIIYQTHYKSSTTVVTPDAVTRAAYETVHQRGIPMVLTPGNRGDRIGLGTRYTYPTCYNWPNFITVAGMTQTEARLGLSSYGEDCVTLGAPAGAIATLGHGTGNPFTETYHTAHDDPAYASAYITGGIALMMRLRPILRAYDIKQFLRRAIQPKTSMARPNTLWGGTVDWSEMRKYLNGINFDPADTTDPAAHSNKRRKLEPSSYTPFAFVLESGVNDKEQRGRGRINIYNVDEEYNILGTVSANFGVNEYESTYFERDTPIGCYD